VEKKGNNKKSIIKIVLAMLLTAYLGYVFFSTVFGRDASANYKYKLELFWSYKVVIDTGSKDMAKEILMNYLMLVPLGFVLPWILDGSVSAKKIRIITILAGFFTTCTIEILQLVLKRGLFEFDDILGNTIGTIVGYLFYRLAKWLLVRWKGKRVINR